MPDIVDDATGKSIGRFESRPLAPGSIVRYGGINYDLVGILLDDDCIRVAKREGTFGQYATPDYVLDEAEMGGYPRKFRVLWNFTDGYVGEITLDAPPQVGQKLTVDGSKLTVVDWSIGQRKTDEVYVK